MQLLFDVLYLLFATLVIRNAAAVPTPKEEIGSGIERRGAKYPSVAGRLFRIDGKKQYFSGVNAWWLGHLWTDVNVDQAMKQITDAGYKVARVWAFGNTNTPNTETNVYYQTLNSSGQYFNFDTRNGIPRLDYVVAKAESIGLKLILTLLNNFDDLGGINAYTNAFAGTHNSFYTDTKSQEAYKKYINFIVRRYRFSSAIFSWELCNEPRCTQCDSSIITSWAAAISKYIKTIDHNHMVSLGDEGWLLPSYQGGDGTYAYSGYEGVDFIKNLAIPTIDYGTVHMYPNQWGYDYSWGSTWITQHNGIGKAANKPIVMEEYAAPSVELRREWMPQWQETILTNTSIAADMVWQFATAFADGNNPYDEYAIYSSDAPESEFQTLGVKQAKAMAAKPPKVKL